MRILAAAVLLANWSVYPASAQTPPPATPPATPPAVEKPRPATPAPQRPRATSTSALSISVRVTDSAGFALPGIRVSATGPVVRSGVADGQGTVRFLALRPGAYRLRFEGDKFITFEREVTLRAGQPADIEVALTPAPAPPPPPPAPKPEPAAPVRMNVRPPEPRTVSIPDYVERNPIGSREPSKSSVLACGATATTSLVQVRDPIKDRVHPDADEFLYVVGGEGTLVLSTQEEPIRLEAGTLALVPRGMTHAIQRRGRGGLVLMAILTDSPCTALKQ